LSYLHFDPDLAPLRHVTHLTASRAWISYFSPITIESAPTSGSTRVFGYYLVRQDSCEVSLRRHFNSGKTITVVTFGTGCRRGSA